MNERHPAENVSTDRLYVEDGMFDEIYDLLREEDTLHASRLEIATGEDGKGLVIKAGPNGIVARRTDFAGSE